jgi:AcrR family transcriptional regulator
MATKKQVKPSRPRDATATRAAILEAAGIVFSRRGYDQVGVREIAQGANVTAALVIRYFGSKAGLFARVMDSKADLAPVLTADRANIGQWLARDLVTKREDRTKFDPMLIILRSAPNAEAAAIIRTTVQEHLSKPLAAWLGGRDSSERSALIIALISGFDLLRNVIGTADLLHGDQERLIALMGPVFQSYVDAGSVLVRARARKTMKGSK